MNENKIWYLLKEKGYSNEATAALIGNMFAESNCFAPRIQNDFSGDYQRSIVYTASVDDGSISEKEFVYNGPGGGGYGLMQWTFWSRKKGLYALAKKQGKSIGDAEVQVAWLDEELHSAEYAAVLDVLEHSVSIRECTDVLVRKYLRPADQSDAVCAYRAKLGIQIYDRLAILEVEDKDGQTEEDPKIKENKITIDMVEYEALANAMYIVAGIKEILTMLEDLKEVE